MPKCRHNIDVTDEMKHLEVAYKPHQFKEWLKFLCTMKNPLFCYFILVMEWVEPDMNTTYLFTDDKLFNIARKAYNDKRS